jgi:hypothetical protein
VRDDVVERTLERRERRELRVDVPVSSRNGRVVVRGQPEDAVVEPGGAGEPAAAGHRVGDHGGDAVQPQAEVADHGLGLGDGDDEGGLRGSRGHARDARRAARAARRFSTDPFGDHGCRYPRVRFGVAPAVRPG